jgi:hypothetical protein
VQTLALREVDRVVAHRFGAELGDGEVRRRRRAAAQTSAASAGSPLSAKAIALAVARKVSKRVDGGPLD